MSSSSNYSQRRIVHGKRRQAKAPTSTLDFLRIQGTTTDHKRGAKRNFQQIHTPPSGHVKTNLANDRMKRLRANLGHKDATSSNPPNTRVNHDLNRTNSVFTLKNSNSERCLKGAPIQKVSPLNLRLERARGRSANKNHNKRRAKEPIVGGSTAKKSDKGNHHNDGKVFVPTTFTPSSTFSFTQSASLNAPVKTEIPSNSNQAEVQASTSSALPIEVMEWDNNLNEGGGTAQSSNSAPELRHNVSRVSFNWEELTEPSAPMNINCDLYIVVDTNIFISHLQLIKTIVETSLTANGTRPIIYMPWIVFEELDYLKSGPDLSGAKWKAQEAVKYINRALQNNNDRIIGQTVDEVLQQKDTGIKQDDKILASCLQLKESRKNIILLSNDINLKNKALINRIATCSNTEIISRINQVFKKAPKSDQILGLMTILFSQVIRKCALKTYGDNWNKLHMLQTPPQSIDDCIRVFKKYWSSVFQGVLMKQFQKAMLDLSAFLTHDKDIDKSSEALNKLTTLCIRICLFIKDVGIGNSVVEDTIREINEIKDLQ